MFILQGKKGYNNLFIYILTLFISFSGFVSLAVFLMEHFRVDEKDNNQLLLLNLLPFSVVVLAIVVNTAGLHRRSPVTLFNAFDRFRPGRYFFSLSVWLVLLAMGDLAYAFLFSGRYVWHFNASGFYKLLIMSLTLFPIQTLAEELMFRSYLPQGLINLPFRRIFPVLVISSLLFMSVHLLNPENEKFGYTLMVSYYFISGLFLSILTTLDDGIEQSYGIHTATNIYGAVLVGYEGSALQTDALWVIESPVGLVMVVTTFLVMACYYLMATRKYKMRSIKTIFTRIDEKALRNETVD